VREKIGRSDHQLIDALAMFPMTGMAGARHFSFSLFERVRAARVHVVETSRNPAALAILVR
jgi:hypothetical protein